MARHNSGHSNQKWKKIIHVIEKKSCNLIRGYLIPLLLYNKFNLKHFAFCIVLKIHRILLNHLYSKVLYTYRITLNKVHGH